MQQRVTSKPRGVPAGQVCTALPSWADPEWLSRLYSDSPEDERLLLEWWDLAAAVLSRQSGEDVGMCHGEAYPATCREVGGGLAIAELDWVGQGDRAYDLATFRWVLAVHAEDAGADLFDAFVDAYGEVRRVPDLEALQAWVAARHFWSLRLAAGFSDQAGLARRAAFLRRWRAGG